MPGGASGSKANFAAAMRAIAFYNGPFLQLVQDHASAEKLDQAMKKEGVRVDAKRGVWVLGPHTLSEWPPNNPFLMEAARLGAAEIVDRLGRHYKCSAGPKGKDGGSALHQAASFGHADVVATLLDLRADPKHQNRKGKTALDSARQGLEDWKSGKFKFPTLSGQKYVFDFRTRDASWPQWEKVIRRLS